MGAFRPNKKRFDEWKDSLDEWNQSTDNVENSNFVITPLCRNPPKTKGCRRFPTNEKIIHMQLKFGT